MTHTQTLSTPFSTPSSLLHLCLSVLFISFCLFSVHCRVLFEENFDHPDLFNSTWSSAASSSEVSYGRVQLSHGRWYGDEDMYTGMHTMDNYRQYLLWRPITPAYTFNSRVFVLQYSLKHEQMIECGGGALKFWSDKPSSKHSPFVLKFGPDMCGTETRHVLIQFAFPKLVTAFPNVFQSTVFKLKNKLRMRGDHVTHFYTLVLERVDDASGDYELSVWIDGNIALWEDDTLAQGRLSQLIDWKDNTMQGATFNNDPVSAARYFQLEPLKYVGVELWQVIAGSIFDNIVLSDSLSDAEAARQRFVATGQQELDMYQEWYAADEADKQKIRDEVSELRKKQDEELAKKRKQMEEELINRAKEESKQPQSKPATTTTQQTASKTPTASSASSSSSSSSSSSGKSGSASKSTSSKSTDTPASSAQPTHSNRNERVKHDEL